MSVVCYFLLVTFIIAWTSWGTLIVLTQTDLLSFSNPLTMLGFIIGGISPAISGFITRYKFGKAEFREFLRSHIRFSLHVGWYVFLFLVPLVLTAVSWISSLTTPDSITPFFNQPVYMVLVLLPVMVLGGGVEEIGWRGVLLPELVKKQSAFSAAILIGVIWLIWHMPLAFVKGSPQSTLNWGWYSLSIMTMSLVYTAFYLRTRSIGMLVLFHALFNVYAGMVIPQPSNPWVDGAAKIVLSLGIFFALMKNYNRAANNRVL